jgi:hypothetical protein
MKKLRSISFRAPDDFILQLRNRAKLHRRTLSSEILYMLESYVDDVVRQDQELLKQMRDLSQAQERQP